MSLVSRTFGALISLQKRFVDVGTYALYPAKLPGWRGVSRAPRDHEVVHGIRIGTRSERCRYGEVALLNLRINLAEHDTPMLIGMCMFDGDGKMTTMLSLRGATFSKSVAKSK